MNALRRITNISLFIVCTLFVATTVAHAAGSCGGPSQPSGLPPYGLAVQGDAGGTKLSGIVSFTFNNYSCSKPESPACMSGAVDLADAIVALQLKSTGNVEVYDEVGNLLKAKTKQWTTKITNVRFNDADEVQRLAEDAFKCPILNVFFGVDLNECIASPLEISLKTVSEFWVYGYSNVPDGTISILANLELAIK